MSECVLCLGNRRKQTFKVEILISELQSKLWKQDLRALNRGPHPVRKSGIPPENTLHTHLADPRPPPRVDGSSISHFRTDTLAACLWVAQLRKVPSLFVPTNTTVRSLCALSLDLAVYCCLKAHFPSKFVMLLVSGTFFFPTSEINEISISHFTKVIMPLFPPTPNKWHLVQV